MRKGREIKNRYTEIKEGWGKRVKERDKGEREERETKRERGKREREEREGEEREGRERGGRERGGKREGRKRRGEGGNHVKNGKKVEMKKPSRVLRKADFIRLAIPIPGSDKASQSKMTHQRYRGILKSGF